MEHIFSMICPKFGNHVTLTLPAYAIGLPRARFSGTELLKYGECYEVGRFVRMVSSDDLCKDPCGKILQGLVSYVSVKTIDQFPEPMDRNVNMLPFVFGDKSSLPENYKCYHDLIEQCPYMEDEICKVGASWMRRKLAHRTEDGIHIETPGAFLSDVNSSIFLLEESWRRTQLGQWDILWSGSVGRRNLRGLHFGRHL